MSSCPCIWCKGEITHTVLCRLGWPCSEAEGAHLQPVRHPLLLDASEAGYVGSGASSSASQCALCHAHQCLAGRSQIWVQPLTHDVFLVCEWSPWIGALGLSVSEAVCISQSKFLVLIWKLMFIVLYMSIYRNYSELFGCHDSKESLTEDVVNWSWTLLYIKHMLHHKATASLQ